MPFSANVPHTFVSGSASWDCEPDTVALITTRRGNAVADSAELFTGTGPYDLATPQWPVAEGYWEITKDSIDDTTPRFDMRMPSLYYDSIGRAFEATFSPGPSAMFDSPFSGNWLDFSDNWSDASSDSDSRLDASSDDEGYFSDQSLVALTDNMACMRLEPYGGHNIVDCTPHVEPMDWE